MERCPRHRREKIITKESEWLTDAPERKKLWNDYENFPSWLIELIEKDIDKCKRGDHSWGWEPSESWLMTFRCNRTGCNAESKIDE